jgi:asparaginyl-tRNA synthetase
MIEPEIAFCDIVGNMDIAEDFLKETTKYVLENCEDDLKFLSNRITQEEKSLPQDKRQPMELIEKLRFVIENDFERITYTEAVDILRNSKPNKKKQFEYPVNDWGVDLQSEHERFLVEKHFKKPVIITGYPAKIKAFYMKLNDDGKTVAAMDILFPGIGEIVGGSQREERYDVLLQKVKDFNIPEESVWWYLDTRKFGTVEHSGFGLGFERMMMFITGMTNIRDVIPFPRTPKNCEF